MKKSYCENRRDIEVGDLVCWSAISGSLGIVVERREYNYCKVCWLVGGEISGSASVLPGGAVSALSMVPEGA